MYPWFFIFEKNKNFFKNSPKVIDTFTKKKYIK